MPHVIPCPIVQHPAIKWTFDRCSQLAAKVELLLADALQSVLGALRDVEEVSERMLLRPSNVPRSAEQERTKDPQRLVPTSI